MSTTEVKTLQNLIKTTWKNLALADQADAEVIKEILTELLDELETVEDAE